MLLKSLINLHHVFALDHVHLVQWLPVHIQDMYALSSTHPSVNNEFQNGSFVIQ